MVFKESDLTPPPRPQIQEAKLIGDVALEAQICVVVGCVGFYFRRDEEDWTGGEAFTAARGGCIDEKWITTARQVAIEALKREVGRRGLGEEIPTDTFQCGECGKLLCSEKLVRDVAWVGVDCGPTHTVRYKDGRVLVLHHDGSSDWVTFSRGDADDR